MQQNLDRNTFRTIALSFFLISFFTEVMRIANPAGKINKVTLAAFRPFMRSSETHEYSGMMYYVFGIVCASSLFSRTATSVGIMCLASLDPVAALSGSKLHQDSFYPRFRNGKSLVGFMFSAIAGTAVCFVLFSKAGATNQTGRDMLAMSILIGCGGAFAEFLTPTPRVVLGPKKFPLGIDDNAIIPVVCSAMCDGLLKISRGRVTLSSLLLL